MAQDTLTPVIPVEVRLTALENEMAALKGRVQTPTADRWLDDVIGSMKDMPDFDEAVRLGQEARRAQPLSDEVPA